MSDGGDGSLGHVAEAERFHFPGGDMSMSPKPFIKPDPDAPLPPPLSLDNTKPFNRPKLEKRYTESSVSTLPRQSFDTRPTLPISKRSLNDGPGTQASSEHLRSRPRPLPQDDSNYQYGAVGQPPSPPYSGGMSRDRKYASSQGIAGRQDPPPASYAQRPQQGLFQQPNWGAPPQGMMEQPRRSSVVLPPHLGGPGVPQFSAPLQPFNQGPPAPMFPPRDNQQVRRGSEGYGGAAPQDDPYRFDPRRHQQWDGGRGNR